ncbi:MAG: FAD synthase [Candidatus Diapherotrites archaeon]|nr:FAD synthase [Candidatus Diapherotrites archaeon]
MKREKVVLAFGTFDILHLGHIHYLKKARALGTELIVVVARDETVAREKGTEPVKDEKQRVAIVRALKFVDKAVLGLKGDKMQVILKYKPDVIALGYDHKVSKQTIERFLKRHGLQAKVVRIRAYKPAKYKSSLLKKKIQATTLDLGIDII